MVGRRLDSFSSSMDNKERIKVLDIFSQKLVNSGHNIKTIRNILVGGIKGYKRKVARCQARGEPVHRSAGQSAGSRRSKKLLAKSQWFRKEKPEEMEAGDRTAAAAATAIHTRVARKATGERNGTNT